MVQMKYDTDVVMRKLWLHLLRDFRTSFGLEYATRPAKYLLDGGIKAFRAYKWPARSTVSPYLYKADYQLESLFKRYRFKEDVYSDEQLTEMALEKFIANQERIATPFKRTLLVDMWLKKARTIATKILGEYSLEEHYDLCRFGKRACVGTTYSNSYLDIKLDKKLTGSTEHISWFSKYQTTDSILSCLLEQSRAKRGGPLFDVCDTLNLALVPKSYKSFRSILANTLLGSFVTLGLGKVIQSRLADKGLDIRHLQKRHGDLARTSSLTRQNATADLSAASDSISRELLRMILPTKWYHACTDGAIPYVNIKGKIYRMSSIVTMGMGHTFPLQTLVFYCLIKAIGELKGESSTFVSVYGDDLIYPRRLHRYVRTLFPMVHLHLNGDKTYVEDYFRESCGSDFYHGVDVRPFCFQGGHQLVDRKRYAVFLYKLLNGLTRRWEKVEIPFAIDYILSEIILTQESVLQVPPSFPDGSGYKVERPKTEKFFAPVAYATSTQTLVFKYLHVCPNTRVVSFLYPYYWERLRVSHNMISETQERWDVPADEPCIRWIRTKHPPHNYRSDLTGRRLRHLSPVVSSKNASKLACQTGSVADWI
jgi:hypothetical protein